jgi:hypothetical protein
MERKNNLTIAVGLYLIFCPLSEPAVDLRQPLSGLFPLALLLLPRRTAKMKTGLVVGYLEIAHLLSQFHRSIKVGACCFRLTSLPRLYRFFEDRLQCVR